MAYIYNDIYNEVKTLSSEDFTQTMTQLMEKFIEKNFSGELKEFLFVKWTFSVLTHENDIENGKRLVEKYKTFAHHLSTGNPAPNFTCLNQNGKKISLNDLKGKDIYLDIWASWCAPCKMEIPFAQKLEEEMKNQNIVFLYMSIDEDEMAWKKAINENNLNGMHLIASGSYNSEIAKLYNVKGIPHYITINKEGKIVDSNAKRPSGDIKKDLVKLLK